MGLIIKITDADFSQNNVGAIIPTDPNMVTVILEANPEIGGEVIGGGTQELNSTGEIQAIPALGYTFEDWSDQDINANRTIVFDVNKTLIANFLKEPLSMVYSDDLSPVNYWGDGETINFGQHPNAISNGPYERVIFSPNTDQSLDRYVIYGADAALTKLYSIKYKDNGNDSIVFYPAGSFGGGNIAIDNRTLITDAINYDLKLEFDNVTKIVKLYSKQSGSFVEIGSKDMTGLDFIPIFGTSMAFGPEVVIVEIV